VASCLVCCHVVHHRFLDAKHHANLLSNLLLENSLGFGVNTVTTFQKVVGNFYMTTVVNLGSQHPRFLWTSIPRVLENICIYLKF
jgi:hypothetical protein